MKTCQTLHVTVFVFEACILVTRNIQWEVTLAYSALRAPLHGLHHQKHSPALQRLLAGAATQANKCTKEIMSLKQLTSPLIIISVQTCLSVIVFLFHFELLVQRFSA